MKSAILRCMDIKLQVVKKITKFSIEVSLRQLIQESFSFSKSRYILLIMVYVYLQNPTAYFWRNSIEQQPPQPIHPRFPSHYRQLGTRIKSFKSMVGPGPYMQFTFSPVLPKLLGIRNVFITKSLRRSRINIGRRQPRKICCTSRGRI